MSSFTPYHRAGGVKVIRQLEMPKPNVRKKRILNIVPFPDSFRFGKFISTGRR